MPTFADMIDVPGLGISLSLVNFDEHFRYVWGSIAVVEIRIPVQGLVDADIEPVVAYNQVDET